MPEGADPAKVYPDAHEADRWIVEPPHAGAAGLPGVRRAERGGGGAGIRASELRQRALLHAVGISLNSAPALAPARPRHSSILPLGGRAGARAGADLTKRSLQPSRLTT